jgi:hypothetical protein
LVLYTAGPSVAHASVVSHPAYAGPARAALDWMAGAGLVALGRFGRFEYDNSDQCVIKARALAAELLAQAVAG